MILGGGRLRETLMSPGLPDLPWGEETDRLSSEGEEKEEGILTLLKLPDPKAYLDGEWRSERSPKP